MYGFIRQIIKFIIESLFIKAPTVVDQICLPVAKVGVPKFIVPVASNILRIRHRYAFNPMIIVGEAKTSAGYIMLRHLLDYGPNGEMPPIVEFISGYHIHEGNDYINEAIVSDGFSISSYPIPFGASQGIDSFPADWVLFRHKYEDIEVALLDQHKHENYFIDNADNDDGGTVSLGHFNLNLTCRHNKSGQRWPIHCKHMIVVKRVEAEGEPRMEKVGKELIIYADRQSGISRLGHFKIVFDGQNVRYIHLSSNGESIVNGEMIWESGTTVNVTRCGIAGDEAMSIVIGDYAFDLVLGAHAKAVVRKAGGSGVDESQATINNSSANSSRQQPRISSPMAGVIIRGSDYMSQSNFEVPRPRAYLALANNSIRVFPSSNGKIPEGAFAVVEYGDTDIKLTALEPLLSTTGGSIRVGDQVSLCETGDFALPDGSRFSLWLEEVQFHVD